MPGIESLLIGRVLGGRYRIEEVIGRGGMGAVYRAVDERLGRPVALKVITVGGAAEAETRERLRARFYREARSAAALPHHPNVVPVYDYGSDEELGLDYLVMELLRGSDLASRLARSGPPDLSAGLRILVEAARGVAVGHRQGLIHRDVKPGNIFLARTHDGQVQVRVVDFGIAKLADEEDTLAQLTQDGRAPHSPAYASPEQLRGLSNLTPAADVFGLGAVGYQLLTGERPFNESDRNRMSLGMPVKPPPPRQYNPAIPGSIEAAILRALEFDPENRYPDAEAMAADLEAAMRGIASTPVEPYIGGAAIISAAEEEAGDDEDRTLIAPAGPAGAGTAGPPGEEDRTLLAPPPPEPTAGRAERAGRAAERPPRRAAAPKPAAPRRRDRPRRRGGIGGVIVWGLVMVVLIGAALWAWQEMQRPVPVVFGPEGNGQAEPEPVDTIPAIDPDELQARDLNIQGTQAYVERRFDDAVRLFERAVELAPDIWHFRRNYGLALHAVGRYEDARRELERAIEIDPGGALAYANLGSVQLALGDTTDAIGSYETYIELETDPAQRERAEQILREIEIELQPGVDLLGEPIPGQRPGEPPAAADTPTVPATPELR